MKQTMFERFCSESNLRLAYKFLKQEFERSSLRTDPIWYPTVQAIDNNDEAYFSGLSKLLSTYKYKPQPPQCVFAIKDSLAQRRIAVLNVTDRIVYQALLNQKVLGSLLDSKVSSFSYSPTLAQDNKKYFKNYKNCWDKFKDAQIKAFKVGYTWAITFDISGYFDNIYILELYSVITDYCGVDEPALTELLKKQLNKWSFKQGYGIPQGPDVSSLLSNVYLSKLDTSVLDYLPESVKVFRYQDDYVVQGKDEQSVHRVAEQIISKLMELNLSVNSKTRISLVNIQTLCDEKFDPQYKHLNDRISKKHFDEIKWRVPEIVSKYKNEQFDKITKQDISDLKYYLKVPTIPSRQLLLDIVEILPRIQFLIVEATQFIYRADLIHIDNAILDMLFTVWEKYHFYKLPKLWLAKLILSYDYIDLPFFDPKYDKTAEIQNSVVNDLINSDDWLSQDIGLYFQASKDKDISKKLLLKILSPVNEFDLAMSISSFKLLKDCKDDLAKLHIHMHHFSCDVNIITYDLTKPSLNDLSSEYSTFSQYLLNKNVTHAKGISTKFKINNKVDGFTSFSGLKRVSDKCFSFGFYLHGEGRCIYYLDVFGHTSAWTNVDLDANYYKLLRFFVGKGMNSYYFRSTIVSTAKLNFRTADGEPDTTKAFNNIFNLQLGKKFKIKASEIYDLRDRSLCLKIPVHLITDSIEHGVEVVENKR